MLSFGDKKCIVDVAILQFYVSLFTDRRSRSCITG